MSNNPNGSVFEISASTHQLTTLCSFTGTNGQEPQAGLYADASGNLYGTTYLGGTNSEGTVFEIANTGFYVVPETSTLFLAAIGLMAFAVPILKRVKGASK